MSAISGETISVIADVFKDYPDIQAVYLFGSSASGKRHIHSDIDLAVVPASPRAREKRELGIVNLCRDVPALLADAGYITSDMQNQ